MLSDISRLFDPLGLLGPLIITAKMFLQKLWILRIYWDDEVPLHLNREWEKFSSELSQLKNVNIDRHVLCSKVLKVDLIGIGDASKNAYGFAVYTRSWSRSGVFPSTIQQLDIWWNGPSFFSSSSWPNFNDDPGVSDDEYLLEKGLKALESLYDDNSSIEIEPDVGSTSDLFDEDWIASNTASESESSDHAYTCGSTGTAVVIDGNRIYIANVGNTRCVLSRGRQAVRLSVDHTPSNAEEYSRITAAGATVSETGLINNSLSVSRAFGNFQYKSSDLPTSILSAEPYVRTIDIQPDDEFLVIASNGVWNCFHDYEVVEFVHRKLERNRELHGYCHDMCEHLIYRTRYMEGVGTGNLTVMIIQLNVNADH
ncbi:putative protein phosphatase CG10417 like protein [Argiope bruennichi]|uniref:protein-serine/threonine phosphatase n=1 Tax=Argiope bruennichi TaxID=94029 RepID=A0A8T0F3I9_ARGBR|nr:putative protein phosphatase CG10417 like protein [Argiope bruennichi]